jgi:hypothetical protein
MTAWRASSSPQAVVQTLSPNLLFLFFYLSLFTTLNYYLSYITPDLLPLGYYPDVFSFPRLNLFCKPLVPLSGKSHAVPATERPFHYVSHIKLEKRGHNYCRFRSCRCRMKATRITSGWPRPPFLIGPNVCEIAVEVHLKNPHSSSPSGFEPPRVEYFLLPIKATFVPRNALSLVPDLHVC